MRMSMMGIILLLASTPVHAQGGSRNRPGDIVYEASISDLQAAMTAGRATSVSLVDGYMARIAAYDHAGPALTAIIRRTAIIRPTAAEAPLVLTLQSVELVPNPALAACPQP